ncbi:unnamed protein product, partial [Rotaria magnacalcarata]
ILFVFFQVSQLRRINNLQNDQEFYALTHCRVPVSRFGLLHKYLESSSTLVDLHEQSRISLPVTHLSQQNHLAFLNAMDQDLALMRTKVEQLIEGSSTTTAAVVPSSLDSSGVKTSTSALNCDETDYGCKFWHIIVIIIL